MSLLVTLHQRLVVEKPFGIAQEQSEKWGADTQGIEGDVERGSGWGGKHVAYLETIVRSALPRS